MVLLSREFIAVPDRHKHQIVYKWPDVSIRKTTKAIVNADELALFVKTGQVVQTLGPGRHKIDADEIPGLGVLIDFATGGNAYRAELYFVATREFPGFQFGGRIDDVQDPQTGLIVTLRTFGDYALRVTDPQQLITNLLGTMNVEDNGVIGSWVSDQLLKIMRTTVTTQIVRNGWPILGLSVYTPELEPVLIAEANEQLAMYGVALTKLGNFDINLAPDDSERLKTLAKDTSYSRLAGSFNQYAAGAMALGAGEGMSQGGAAVGGAFLAAGLGAGGAGVAPTAAPVPPPTSGFAGGPTPSGYAGPPPAAAPAAAARAAAAPAAATPSAPTPSAPADATVACAQCDNANPAGAKFCMSCGQPTAPAPVQCANCQTELAPGARFCMNCGTPTAPPSDG